jgi:hypothetical protein
MSNADKIIDLIKLAQTPTGNKVIDHLMEIHEKHMITNSKTIADHLVTDICKILVSPFGQDARISEVDKLVAKKVSAYMLNWIKTELDVSDERHDLINLIILKIDEL